MPQLNYVLQPVGMACDVLIGLDGKTTSALVVAGQAIPAPVRCRGLIDSGSDVTCVAAAILRQLGLNMPTVQTTTQTATSLARVDLYDVSLSVLDLSLPQGPSLVLPGLLVMELPAALTDFDVLIGMDLLLTARLVLDGPRREFSLEF